MTNVNFYLNFYYPAPLQAKHAGKTFFTCHRCKITFFGEMEYEEHIKTHPKGKIEDIFEFIVLQLLIRNYWYSRLSLGLFEDN